MFLSKNENKLTDGRLKSIIEIYDSVSEDEWYSHPLFILTLEKTFKKPPKPDKFHPYLHRAMLNNITDLRAKYNDPEARDRQLKVSNPTYNKNIHGLPEWIVKQIDDAAKEATPQELSEEQKKEAIELLQALGEFG
ncbi:hypothetical protein BLGI_4999 [Brevibacillus laterosporus GI-9]|uniref:hypothetical protein n=1 Tax=Brevibacillus laterosporus TaxID=1465 RepID=UPI00024052D5|nr:hypothetical protein [Brevibacillus laterosporus]CCF17018.1 hypothetical protein BLGI_4999 [Brevibacillus laterosporus GI-9]